MMREWSDRMVPSEATELWDRCIAVEHARRVKNIEQELSGLFDRQEVVPSSFYAAMGHFVALRDKLFPKLSSDPAWRILLTLAQTPENSDRASVTGITHGAGVPLTTTLRYLAIMEVEGIITRRPHPNDGRQVMIELTDDGRHRLAALERGWVIRMLILMLIPAGLWLSAPYMFASG